VSKYSKGHTVYINSKGEEVPSVTTVLKVINKPSLVGWANYMGFMHEKIDKVLNESANIGTDFHDMVSKYTTNEEITGEHYNDAIALFKSFVRWAKENEYKTIFAEKSLTSKLFGGTIDSLSHVNGELCMVDYKTSKNIYPSMFLQLAGYSLLVKENLPETYSRIDKFGILSISIKNGIQSKFITKKELEKDCVPVFKDALKLFHSWFNMNESMFGINIAK
jgi:ATP-dependent exoDNAse (exonuclease V) beta subunit